MKLDDGRIRSAAFAFLTEEIAVRGEVLPWATLVEGFTVDGHRVPLASMQGIFRPAVLAEVPLTIRTAADDGRKPRPYDDAMGADGLMVYRYRGTDLQHRDNVGLRLAMTRQTPLIYLFGIVEGQYMPVWPVYVVGDDAPNLSFKIAFDARELSAQAPASDLLQTAEPRRTYVTRVTLQRVHQRTFSQRVLAAYKNRCAMCRLAHPELLDAAHILPDGHPRGEPIVPNGLALCKLHHAAFDQHIVGIRPDRVIEVRRDILEEVDGPMLRHGIQGMAGQALSVPRAETARPRAEFLEERYAMFRRAG